jgi:uncharacterized membrane protein
MKVMIDNILSFWAPGPFEMLVVFVFFGITVVLIVVFLRLLLRNKKENIRLRLEVGKLADELEKVRKNKSAVQDNSSNKSG